MYQKYIIDVAVYPSNKIAKYDKYCNGLIVYKKFTDEKIKEEQEIEKLFGEL